MNNIVSKGWYSASIYHFYSLHYLKKKGEKIVAQIIIILLNDNIKMILSSLSQVTLNKSR